MTRCGGWRTAILFLLLGLSAGACTTKRVPVGFPTPPPKEGFVNVLDASHAPLWKETQGRENVFDIQGQVLHIPGTFGPLKYVGYLDEPVGDFELHLEFKVTSGANSGVILRGSPEAPHWTGLEVQVLDSHGKRPDVHSCGAVYDVVTPMFEMARPAGEWNSYDIAYVGRHLVVVMNGWKIIDTDLSVMTQPIGKFDTPYAKLPLKGYIFLQDHHREVWYRNIFLKRM
jgi:hypothetical protein